MRITRDRMNTQLRARGVLARTFLGFRSPGMLRLAQKCMPLARRFMRAKDLRFEERHIRAGDNPDLRLCLYRGAEPGPGAVGLLWMHGGGYAIGAPEQDIGFYRNLLRAANCLIVSPDYRLSVDAPYPAALDDCYAALRWMRQNAEDLGIRDDQLFVGGDSAGGGLAAAVALRARDDGEVNIAFQMPLYPMLDDRMDSESARDNDAPVWNSRANAIAWEMYLGDLYGAEDVPAYAAPARAPSFAGLPPAYTFVGDLEPFRDETLAYIRALREAGIEAEIDVYPGCYHAFDIICAKSDVARKAAAKYMKRFKYAAAHYFAKQPPAR